MQSVISIFRDGDVVRLNVQGAYPLEVRSKIGQCSPELAFNFITRGKARTFDQIVELFKRSKHFYVVSDENKAVITEVVTEQPALPKAQRYWIIALQALHRKHGPSGAGFEVGRNPGKVDPRTAKLLVKEKWAKVLHGEKLVLIPGPRICE